MDNLVEEMSWYPEKLSVTSEGTRGTYDFMKLHFATYQHFHYAEFGIYKGDTARSVAEIFPNAILHLFDFADTIEFVQEKLKQHSHRIHYYPNTERFNDSYNWSLIKLIESQKAKPFLDYCFLDGAHTVSIDALNFYLADKLLRVGGFMDFDDYVWRLRGSSLDPIRVPEIAMQYTEEQIDAYQVKMIVDNLVKTDPRYVEVVANKVYQKKKDYI